MGHQYPVLTGSNRQQFESVALALGSVASLVRTGFDAGREVIIPGHSVVFRIRKDGTWAFGFWDGADSSIRQQMSRIAAAVPGVAVISSDVFLREWGFVSRAEAAFDLYAYYALNQEAAQRARSGLDIFVSESEYELVARLHLLVTSSPDGWWRQAVSCELVGDVPAELRAAVLEGVSEGSHDHGSCMYLPLDQVARQAWMQSLCRSIFAHAGRNTLVCFTVK